MFKGVSKTDKKAQQKLKELWAEFDKPKDRKLKPLSIEYIHLKRYKKKIDDPFNKQAFYEKDYQENDKSAVLLEKIVKGTIANLSLQSPK